MLGFASKAPLVASRHFYRYPRLVRRRTLPQPGVSSTLRKARREEVASCESNLGYLKPSYIILVKTREASLRRAAARFGSAHARNSRMRDSHYHMSIVL